MAAPKRQPRAGLDPLPGLLREQNLGRYGFFAVVDLLARHGSPVRFTHDFTLAFHPGELRRLDVEELPSPEPGGAPRRSYRLTACFLGLIGSSGPVPLYLSELTAGDDEAAGLRRALLSPFHHRIYELFYRAGRRCDLPRSYTTGAGDPWSRRLLAWLGTGTLSLATLRPSTLLHLAPLLASRVRSARALTLSLRHILAPWLPPGAGLEVEQFVGGTLRLGPGSQMQLGQPQTLKLGHSTVIGTRCRDPAGAIRIHVGPVSASLLTRFSPGGPAFASARELVALFLRSPIDVELDVATEGAASPPLGTLRLGRDFRLVAPGASRRHFRFRLSDGATLDPGPA